MAFHLAKAGRQVALVDKHALGSQTSPRAAGLTSQARGTDMMTQLAKRAVRKIERFEEETGEQIVYHQPGALKIARLPEHLEQLKGEVARATAHGHRDRDDFRAGSGQTEIRSCARRGFSE